MSGGTSYNGWPCSSDPAAIDVDTGWAGGLFPGGVRAGDVGVVLGYVGRQLHERVEPLVDGWNWGYEYRENVNNPGSMSCHASGTALDYNAPNHPNGGPRYGGWSDDQVTEIYRILDEVQGAVQWGADYSGTKDPMHFEIIVDAATLADVAATLPAGGDDMPLTDDDVDRIADRVWSQIIKEADNAPVWRILLDARDVMASKPAILAPQTVVDAIAQIRNDVAT